MTLIPRSKAGIRHRPNAFIVQKTPPNKKRPKLSRVMGRPNSPPPGLLTYEGTSDPQKCKSHLRANVMARTGHIVREPLLASGSWLLALSSTVVDPGRYSTRKL